MFTELFTEGLYPHGNIQMAKKDIQALLKKTFSDAKLKVKKSTAYGDGGVVQVFTDTSDPQNIKAAAELDKLLFEEISNKKGTYSKDGILGVKKYGTHFYYLIESLQKPKYWK